jgi:hypothetical protein
MEENRMNELNEVWSFFGRSSRLSDACTLGHRFYKFRDISLVYA